MESSLLHFLLAKHKHMVDEEKFLLNKGKLENIGEIFNIQFHIILMRIVL